ncbi:MAG: hypothetical protein P9M11_02030 [Candidatus Tenebribacter burtonii]|jgi:hypothetical protein|nr:hypothetical protein [Candidatus Tenebribacter burtonii]
MSKRVVIIIVEGDSDEELLINRLREIFEDNEILFEPQNGDIFYDYNSDKPIKAIVGNIAKAILTKRKFKPSDILAILHIMDTDGCFVKEENVIINSTQDIQTFYNPNSISVIDRKQQDRIIKRNKKRRINVKEVNSISSIVGSRYKYQLYYFSRNLEHVIFNEPNPKNKSKYDNIEEFLDNLTEPIEQYLMRYLPDLANTNYSDNYRQSWSFIEQEINSLQRFTNVPLLIDFINEIIK